MDNFEKMLVGITVYADAEPRESGKVHNGYERFRHAFNTAVDERVAKMRVVVCGCQDYDVPPLCCPICGGSGLVLKAKEE